MRMRGINKNKLYSTHLHRLFMKKGTPEKENGSGKYLYFLDSY
jgi:hypothetical protein